MSRIAELANDADASGDVSLSSYEADYWRERCEKAERELEELRERIVEGEVKP